MLGFITALLLMPISAFAVIRLGLVDPRADIPVNAIERRVAMPSLDAAVERRAPSLPGALDESDSGLIAGMAVYQEHCALCHGDVAHPRAALAEALYPRAPQFVRDAPDMPAHENLYIVEHGVRLTGMPAWGRILSQRELRQVTAFLARLDSLPTPVAERWKFQAREPADTSRRAR